jgi:drug/metabolite transporter (DMT)-like permease
VTPNAGFRDPRIFLPFILIILIWGSTWIVIKDQLGTVPGPWSVTYRFIIGSAAMFAIAALMGAKLRLGREAHLFAVLFGIPQFCLNFNAVYAAEHYVTSGLVATVFALLMVPNTALAWLFLRQRVSANFAIGSAIACVGVALLFVQEMRASAASPTEVAIGVGLTLVGVLSASVANVMQASPRLGAWPLPSLIAWGMFYAAILDALVAWAISGPPVIETRLTYWVGLLYLGLIASALAFSLYFRVIRAVGPGKAAYSSLIIPIIAMAISTFAEGYRWSPLAIAGGLLALAGMAVALRSRRPEAPAAIPAD